MIAILGAGISGLAAAYQLQKEGKKFLILEAGDKVGGKVQSISKNGFHFELGPNTVLRNNTEILQLIDDLNLNKEIILPDSEAVNNRFVLKNSKVEAFPTSISKAIQSNLFSWNTLFSILGEPFKKASSNNGDESLADFTRRRFGSQILDDYITPFVTGIYAGDPEKMSVRYCMQVLNEAEQKHGSVIRGMMKIRKGNKKNSDLQQLPKQKIFSFQKGLYRLIEALEGQLTSHILKKANINAIFPEKNNNAYTIQYSQDGIVKTLPCQQIISAIPAPELAALTSTFSPQLSQALSAIPYVDAISLNVSCNTSAMDFKQKAFGILSKATEQAPFLGILFNSRFFPIHAPEGKELITIICGGYRQPELINKSDKEIHQIVDQSLSSILGIREQTELLYLQKWKSGIPQYELKHHKIVDSIKKFEAEYPNFTIIGNFIDGVSVSDCIAKGINKTKTVK